MFCLGAPYVMFFKRSTLLYHEWTNSRERKDEKNYKILICLMFRSEIYKYNLYSKIGMPDLSHFKSIVLNLGKICH